MAQSPEYSVLLQQAEGAYKRGSWGVSYELYQRLAPLAPSREEARRIQFRIADSQWRIRGSDDPVTLVRSRDRLRSLVTELSPQELTMAEAQESLGDLYWTIKRVSNWKVARAHYEAALSFWLSSPDKVVRQDRIFSILSKIMRPPWRVPTSLYGEAENFLSPALLLRIVPHATSPENVTAIHLMLAQTLNREGLSPEQVRSEFELAIRAGKGTRWHDEVLFAFAQWEERQELGAVIPAAESRALPLYRELTANFKKSTSPFFERAEQLSRIISSPELKLSVPSVVPGRTWSYSLQTRNVRSVSLSLFRFDPDETIDPASPVVGRAHWGVGEKRWFDLVPQTKRTPIKQWNVSGEELLSEGPRSEATLLARGAYILQATGGGMTVREPFFVTDLYLGYTRLTDRVRLFAASLSTGAPIAGVKFKVWEKRSTAIDTPVLRSLGESGVDGVFELVLKSPAPDTQFLDPSIESRELFELLAVAKSPAGDLAAILDPEVFATRDGGAPWEVHVRSEKSRYCPGDTFQFQLFAKKRDWFRRSHDRVISELVHPFQNVVLRNTSPITEFGSASGIFSLSNKWRPGEYRIDLFYTTSLGGAKKKMGEYRFRVEEDCTPP